MTDTPHLLVVQLEPSTGPKLRHALMRTLADTLGVHGVTDLSVLNPKVSMDELLDLVLGKRKEAPAA